MTIYMAKPWYDRKHHRKSTRKFRTNVCVERQGRAICAFFRQMKRYPKCKNVDELRSGWKTNTDIFPMGYDPTWTQTRHEPYPEDFLAINLADHGWPEPIVLSNGLVIDDHSTTTTSLFDIEKTATKFIHDVVDEYNV